MRILFNLFLLFLAFPSFSQSGLENQENYIMVRFQEKVNGEEFIHNFLTAERYNSAGFKYDRQVSKTLNIYRIKFHGISAQGTEIIKTLKQQKEVLDAGFDTPLTYRNVEPNDDLFKEQWNLNRIQVPEVWNETTGGKSAKGDEIVIAVLEKGIDLNHPDLKDNIWKNTLEIPDNKKDDDRNGYVDDYWGLNMDDKSDNHPILRHGTQVSGIIGAKGNNTIGAAGINWNVKILFISGVDLASEVIEAYEYLLNFRKKYNESKGKNGSFIVATNNSFGWDNTKPKDLTMGLELCQMFNQLGGVGILSVGSGPNNNVNVEAVGDTPTNCESDFFIGVTSTDQKDAKSVDGGFGKISIDIGAPGENIQSTDKDSEYGIISGTSAAAPHVTGAIGLLYALPCTQLSQDALSNAPQTAKFIKNIIMAGTDAVAGLKDRTVSGGRLNVFKAMVNLQAYCGTRQGEKLDLINLYPNPSSSDITIEYEAADYEPHVLTISNALGQIVFEKAFTPPRFVPPVIQEKLVNLSPGVYFASIKNELTKVTKTFVVN